MSSIDSPTTREKFNLLWTIAFILEKPFTSFCEGIELASWQKFCTTLFKFNSAEIKFGNKWCELFRNLDFDFRAYGNFAPTQRLVPEPIRSHRIASVAISCLQYLHRWDSNTSLTRGHFLASWLSWATKSKQSPWLWRRRMQVALVGRCRQRIWNHDGHNYSFPLNLRRSRQIFHSETIQSESFYQEQRIFCAWTLDLLYHTLRKAMKSDELTRALSKPFIPSFAPLLFPRRVKRVREAANAYLEKVSRIFLFEDTG